jgi:hypothetical protein
MKIKVFNILIELKKQFIESLTLNDLKNHNGTSFSRTRKLTLARLLVLILRCSPYSLQIRLDNYYKEIGHKEDVVSKQAFSKARTNLDPQTLRDSFVLTAKTLSSCEDLELFKGKFRLCVFDGSYISLDNASELLEHFGGKGPNCDCAMALASLCYDPLNNIILDGGLYPSDTSERHAAKNHFEAISLLPLPKGVHNLYIADRGYPSKELFAHMIDNEMFFFMRVRAKLNPDIDLVVNKKKVKFKYNGKTYSVRVFNISLSSGEKEILVTNLPDRYISYEEAGELYFSRWRIEVKLDSLKNKLELENMSGRRVVTTYQDFWAKLDLANTAAALEYATDEVIDEKNAVSTNKYKQQTNENRLITKLSEQYIRLLTITDSDERLALFEELVADITQRTVEVKPNRQSPRNIPRKKKFSDRRKRVLT